MASFELSAFDRRFQAISVVGAIEQKSPYTLNTGFWIRDPNQLIQWPEASASNPRRDFLWEQTCFEVFLARADQAAYREFNFSPSGDWATYAFADYRRPGEPQESERLAPPRLSILQTAGRVELTAELDASALPPGNAALLVGLTAVVESDDLGDGRHSYWALHHPSERPDFHHRAGFTWVLPTD